MTVSNSDELFTHFLKLMMFFVKSSGNGVVQPPIQIAPGRPRHCGALRGTKQSPGVILMNETKRKRLKNQKQSLSTTALHADCSGETK